MSDEQPSTAHIDAPAPLALVTPTAPQPADTDQTYLSGDDILNLEDREVVDFAIPEWKSNGKTVVIPLVTMSAEESIKFQEEIEGPASKNSDILLIMLCAKKRDPADPDNVEKMTPLWTRAQLAALKKKSLKAIKRLQRQVVRMNAVGEDAKK
jgi:hypothetical protein